MTKSRLLHRTFSNGAVFLLVKNICTDAQVITFVLLNNIKRILFIFKGLESGRNEQQNDNENNHDLSRKLSERKTSLLGNQKQSSEVKHPDGTMSRRSSSQHVNKTVRDDR